MSKTVGMVLKITDKCSPVLRSVAQMFGKNEKEAKKMSQQIVKSNKMIVGSVAAISGAIAGATVAIVSQTKKVSEYGDHIDKTSKRVGLSAKEFQKWDFIMSQNGGNVNNLAGGMKALRNQIAGVRNGSKSSIAIFKELGISIKDSNGHFRSQEEIFNDCVKALQNIKNPTEKAILGQKLFSKGYQEMAPLLDQTVDSIEKLKKEYNDLGLGMSDEDIKKAVEMTDTMDKLGRVFNLVGMQLGVTLLPYVQEFANNISTNIPAIKSGLTPVLQACGNTLGFCATHLRGVTSAVAGLTVGIGAARVGALLFAQSLGAVKIAMASTGIGLAIVGISELVLHWKDLCNWCGKTAEAMKQVFNIKSDKKTLEVETVNRHTDKSSNKPQRHALGTSFSSGGLSWVGENGPELVNLRRGDSVIPADKSAQIASGGNTINISMNVQGNLLGNREFFNEMMNMMAIDLRKALPV